MAESCGASSLKKRNKNRKHRSVSAVADVEATDDAQADQMQLSFEVELAWCIQQLELALHRNVTPRQSAEAVRVLRVLKNPKAALVKKRHAMRTTFGDYRMKMQEEEKTFASSAKNIVLRAAAKEKQEKSTFLHKCLRHMPMDTRRPPMTSERPPTTSNPTPEKVTLLPTSQVDKSQQFIDNKAACFKFNFSVSESVAEGPTDNLATCDSGTNDSGVSSDMLAQCQKNHIETTANCSVFKMLPSDNSFRFNFGSV